MNQRLLMTYLVDTAVGKGRGGTHVCFLEETEAARTPGIRSNGTPGSFAAASYDSPSHGRPCKGSIRTSGMFFS